MNLWTDALLVAIALTGLLVLGSSRLIRCIRLIAFHGVLLGLLTLAARSGHSSRAVLLAVLIIAVKGVAFPRLLSRVLESADVRREVEPFVSYNVSLVAGALMFASSFWLSARLQLPAAPVSPLIVPVALFTILAGLFVIVSRRKALTQVLGYLVLENGICVFGVGLVQHTPMLVELGILLDVFAAVFVMGIAIFHINREFDHIDADRLAALRDWTS